MFYINDKANNIRQISLHSKLVFYAQFLYTETVKLCCISVICTLEGSGHWPEDIDRIRDLKTLYLIDLGEKLADLGLDVSIQETHVDVLKVACLNLCVERALARQCNR